MTKFSYPTMMSMRLLAMSIGPSEFHSWGDVRMELLRIDDILRTTGYWSLVSSDFKQYLTDADFEAVCRTLTAEESVEALKWVLSETRDPLQVLRMLARPRTLHFLGDGAIDAVLFGKEAGLAFFEDFCNARSVRQRLAIAAEAVRLANDGCPARLDLLHFAKDLLLDIKFEHGAPANSRRNLICAGLESVLADSDQRAPFVFRYVTRKDVIFGIEDMLRLIAD